MITSDVAIMKIPDNLPFERKIVHMLLLLKFFLECIRSMHYLSWSLLSHLGLRHA